jgi:hypothetical protein
LITPVKRASFQLISPCPRAEAACDFRHQKNFPFFVIEMPSVRLCQTGKHPRIITGSITHGEMFRTSPATRGLSTNASRDQHQAKRPGSVNYARGRLRRCEFCGHLHAPRIRGFPACVKVSYPVGLAPSRKGKTARLCCLLPDHSFIAEGVTGVTICCEQEIHGKKQPEKCKPTSCWCANLKAQSENPARWQRDITIVRIAKVAGRTGERAASHHPHTEGTPMPVYLHHVVICVRADYSMMVTASGKKP